MGNFNNFKFSLKIYFFFIFKFLEMISSILCFIFIFQVKSVIPSAPGQNYSKYFHFYVVKEFVVVVLQPFFLGVFHYFGHHRGPASQIFNPRLSFDYFNPAIILIFKKLRFGRFMIWFGSKAA